MRNSYAKPYSLYTCHVVQNFGRGTFGRLDELSVIHQYPNPVNFLVQWSVKLLPCIGMIILKIFQTMKNKPDLPDSVIEYQLLVLSQLLTSKKLSKHKT